MERTFSIPVTIRVVEGFPDNRDTIARVFYPNEGNEIHIVKGLSQLEFNYAVCHELGHLFDWYLGEQSNDLEKREQCADIIATGLRVTEHE